MEYFDSPQPETLTDLFLKYIDDKEAMSRLGEKASRHALNFDWADTATQTWKVLDIQTDQLV